jgi:hypothetical protein
MLRKSEMTVWAAVIAGVEYCGRSEAPLVVLGEFLEKLGVKGWDGADLKVVEQCVIELVNWRSEQALRGIKGQVRCSPPSQRDSCRHSAEFGRGTGHRVRWKKHRLARNDAV